MQEDWSRFPFIERKWIKREWRLSGLTIWMDNECFVLKFFSVTARIIDERVLSSMSWIGAWSCPAAFQLCLEASSSRIKRGSNVHRFRDLVRIGSGDWSGESVVSKDGKCNIICACGITGINIDTGQRGAYTAKWKLEIGLEDALVLELNNHVLCWCTIDFHYLRNFPWKKFSN